MSFVRRPDGSVVRVGGHVGTRGSLSELRHGGARDLSPTTPEEMETERKIINACMSFGDYAYGGNSYEEEEWLDPGEAEIIKRIFGIYTRKDPQFSEDKHGFTPGY